MQNPTTYGLVPRHNELRKHVYAERELLHEPLASLHQQRNKKPIRKTKCVNLFANNIGNALDQNWV